MKKPNVLFILIDDMGWRDINCFGSDFYETPEIDKLAADGMMFTDAYAACPVCSPTRASILTGKYPARLGMTQWLGGFSEGKLAHVPYIDHLSTNEYSLAKAFRHAGYATLHVGKWHLSQHNEHRFETYPDKHGFDVNIGGCDWGHPFKGYFSPYGIETLEDGPQGEYLTDRLTDEAIKLINKQSRDKPWFMYLAHYAVHTPIECHAHLVDKYTKKAEKLGINQDYAIVEGELFSCKHKSHERIQRRIIQSDPVYAAMVENLDWNIGRVVEALQKNNLKDETIIIFFSDNGGVSTSEGSPTCNLPLSEGKGWVYEGGTRTPLIISWPGKIPQGVTSQQPLTSTDFYPTLLDLCGLELMPGQHCDGVSLYDLLIDDHLVKDRPIFWHYPHYSNQGGTPACSVRFKNWKLIEFFESEKLELYDLSVDISEKNDLARKRPEITSQLKQLLDNWKLEVAAKIPLRNEI